MKITLPNGIVVDDLTADEALSLIGRYDTAADRLVDRVDQTLDDLMEETERLVQEEPPLAEWEQQLPDGQAEDDDYVARAEKRLTPGQYDTLAYIRSCPEWTCSIAALASDKGINRPRASERLRRLVRVGLVEKIPHRSGLYRAYSPSEMRQRDAARSG